MKKGSLNAIPGNILIVDDTPANLTLLSGLLRERGHRVRPVPSGKLALKAVESDPPDLILLDINMPEMNGFEVCERLKIDRRFRDIPVLFISALTETLDKVKAFNSGGVDYITKPFQFEEVEARVSTHLELRRYGKSLEDLVQEKIGEIVNSQMSTIFALSKLAESRDTDTGAHIERVQILCKALAARLGEGSPYEGFIDADFVNCIYNSSPLHDIGKVAIADSILLKPGKLTTEEFEVMKTHTVIGVTTLQKVHEQYPNNAFIAMGISIARSHHERWDGAGYPDGLAGEKIPLEARIMAVADVYDALRSKRCYKERVARSESRGIIEAGGGAQFDPQVVKAFFTIEEEFNTVGITMGYSQ
jgi:putative two-component system response regulator